MNEVLYWNAVLLEASRRDHSQGYTKDQQRGPTNTSRAMAIVHVAIHDAIAYLVNPAGAYMTKKKIPLGVPVPTGVVIEDAVTGAAITALKEMYPAYATTFDDALHATAPAGFNFGVAVAKALLAARSADGSAGPATVSPSPAATVQYGEHRADPYAPGQPLLSPNWGKVTHFVGPQVPLGSHPGRSTLPSSLLTDAHYKADYDEVHAFGGLDRGARTAEQTLIGVFWAYDGVQGIGVPPRMYNQITRKLIADRAAAGTSMTLAQTADLLAQVNVAMADGGIDAWFHKYDQKLWRPVVGIRHEGPPDGDAFWAPFGAPQTNMVTAKPSTPPFPAYPSGHATFGAALFQILRLVLGKGPALNITDVLNAGETGQPDVSGEVFKFVSDELDGRAVDADGSLRTHVERRFGSFARAVWENAISRVYLGVHWRFDGLPADATQNIGGVRLGLAIGKQVHDLFGDKDSLANY